jgi:hypothetical protein
VPGDRRIGWRQPRFPARPGVERVGLIEAVLRPSGCAGLRGRWRRAVRGCIRIMRPRVRNILYLRGRCSRCPQRRRASTVPTRARNAVTYRVAKPGGEDQAGNAAADQSDAWRLGFRFCGHVISPYGWHPRSALRIEHEDAGCRRRRRSLKATNWTSDHRYVIARAATDKLSSSSADE